MKVVPGIDILDPLVPRDVWGLPMPPPPLQDPDWDIDIKLMDFVLKGPDNGYYPNTCQTQDYHFLTSWIRFLII